MGTCIMLVWVNTACGLRQMVAWAALLWAGSSFRRCLSNTLVSMMVGHYAVLLCLSYCNAALAMASSMSC